MKIPESEHNIESLIDKHHEGQAEVPRSHLGASTLGHPCDRWLWLSFRWAVQPSFPGRILRLFRRGREEEVNIINDLRAIGMDVRKVSSQHRVDFGSHVSGSLDAIIDSGVPEAPKAKHIAEFKTASKKAFDDLVKQGVEKSKPEHYVQMQVYMAGTKIDRALYLTVCKDDDRIHTERVKYDKAVATKAIDRGKCIALADRMPEPISSDPSWYQCKFCDAHDFCHESKITKHVNCRTCAHATALQDSTWHCARWDAVIPLDTQKEGCESHVLHPDLVPWKRKDGPDEFTAIYEINGVDLANGEGDANVYTSKELLANPAACAGGDPFVAELRQDFDGRIVG
jgi:hypothetical protein